MDVDAERSPPRAASPAKREAEADEAPVKRARTSSQSEDKARGRRLFGNLLGTLRKFQDEDKSSRKSAAAKRREETSARIADKLRAETTQLHEIAETERELKTLRIATENATYILQHKEIAMTSRHASLRASAKYLVTSSATPSKLDGALYPSAPLPYARAPTVDAGAPSLFFLPKVLLPHQDEALRSRADKVDSLVRDEEDGLRRDKSGAEAEAEERKRRMGELRDKLAGLKDGAEDKSERRSSIREKEPSGESASRERSPEPRKTGDDDMEVEY